jgi:hypothetical protein
MKFRPMVNTVLSIQHPLRSPMLLSLKEERSIIHKLIKRILLIKLKTSQSPNTRCKMTLILMIYSEKDEHAAQQTSMKKG